MAKHTSYSTLCGSNLTELLKNTKLFVTLNYTSYIYIYIYIYEPGSVKTGLNDIDMKTEITTSLESIGFSIRFLKT